jgi:hypothetical protein
MRGLRKSIHQIDSQSPALKKEFESLGVGETHTEPSCFWNLDGGVFEASHSLLLLQTILISQLSLSTSHKNSHKEEKRFGKTYILRSRFSIGERLPSLPSLPRRPTRMNGSAMASSTMDPRRYCRGSMSTGLTGLTGLMLNGWVRVSAEVMVSV